MSPSPPDCTSPCQIITRNDKYSLLATSAGSSQGNFRQGDSNSREPSAQKGKEDRSRKKLEGIQSILIKFKKTQETKEEYKKYKQTYSK